MSKLIAKKLGMIHISLLPFAVSFPFNHLTTFQPQKVKDSTAKHKEKKLVKKKKEKCEYEYGTISFKGKSTPKFSLNK